MSVNDKFFWDEVMNGINEKFTDEAAELMSHKTRGSGKKDEEDDEYPGFLGPTMKISLTPEERHPKRRIAGGIFAGAAVAAAVAVAVGISAGRNNEGLTSESSSGTLSEVNLTNSGTSETDDVHNVSLDAKIDTDINSYKLDFELYEKYFHGVWENDIYVGYSHAALPDRLKISLDDIKHIGFKQADGGCYMGIFSDAFEQFFFVSGIDHSIMRSGRFDKDSGEHYLSELDENIRRTGDFEDKGTALNLMGMLKLCGEYGVDPKVITDCGILTGKDGRKYALSEDKRPGFALNDMRFNGERENESGQKQLCFSAKWQDITKTYREYFMAFCITKTDDGWSAPEFCADYAPKDDDTPICPDGLIKADGVDYDMIEKVLAGCWKVPGESYGINILYTKTASNDDAEVVWRSCYEDESGWYFLIESPEETVYFIPSSDPDALYYYPDKDGTKSSHKLAMRRYSSAAADTLELSGDLSYTGEQRLLDVMGDDFKDAFLESSFPYHLEDKSAPNQYFNGLSYVYNGDGIHAIIVSEDVVELATRFARDERAGSNEQGYALDTVSDGEQLLSWSFVRKNGEWDYYQPKCYIEGDFTSIYGMFERVGNAANYPDCGVYEDYFFGDWISDTDGSTLTVNYTENMFGDETSVEHVCKGKDGWYIEGAASGPRGTIYYIPFYDKDAMYRYNYTTLTSTLTKNSYSEVFRRGKTNAEYDKELKAGMRLCDMGLEKVLSGMDSAARDAFIKARILRFTDENGRVWKMDTLFGDDEKEWLWLEELDGKDAVLSCYFRTMEIGITETKKYKLALKCKDDGAGSNSYDCVVYDEQGTEYKFYDPYENDSALVKIVEAYTNAYPMFERELYYAAMELGSDTTNYRGLREHSPEEADKLLYDRLDLVVGTKFSKKLTEEPSEPQGTNEPLPTRGKISLSELTRLRETLPETMSEAIGKCLSEGAATDSTGKTWKAGSPGDKDMYLLSNKYNYMTMLVPLYDDDMNVKYFKASFSGYSDEADYELSECINSVDVSYTGEKIEIEGGYYIIIDENALDYSKDTLTIGAPDKDTEATVYFYSEKDGIYYFVGDSIRDPHYTLNGNDLFIFAEDTISGGPNDDRLGTIVSINGGPGKHNTACYIAHFGASRFSAEDIYFLGDYLVGECILNDVTHYVLMSAYEPDGAEPLKLDVVGEISSSIVGTDLKIDETGFTLVVEGEEMRFDTTGNDLEGMYPLLKNKYILLYDALQTDPYQAFGSRSENNDWGSRVCSNSAMFPDYKSFIEWVGGTIAEDNINDVLASCAAKPVETDGLMYYDKVTNVTGQTYGECVLSGIDYTDDDHAVLNIDLYGIKQDENNPLHSVPTNEPTDHCTLNAVRTKDGWRFTDITQLIETSIAR